MIPPDVMIRIAGLRVLYGRFAAVDGLDADGVKEFLGVRYANPPTGSGRFQTPRPVTSWASTDLIVDALAYGNAATQMRSGAGAAAYPPPVQAAMTEAFGPPP